MESPRETAYWLMTPAQSFESQKLLLEAGGHGTFFLQIQFSGLALSGPMSSRVVR